MFLLPMAKKTKLFTKNWGIFLIDIWLFCHKFWTRNATKSIKLSTDSYYSLESKKTLSHEISSIGWLPGDEVIQI